MQASHCTSKQNYATYFRNTVLGKSFSLAIFLKQYPYVNTISLQNCIFIAVHITAYDKCIKKKKKRNTSHLQLHLFA